MIPPLRPLIFLLIFTLCSFIHNGSAFRHPDDTSMPGQAGSEILIPEPEEPPPEDGRSVYDPDVYKQWQGLQFTDDIPEEPEMIQEEEGPVMPSYPWRGGGHDPLPLTDPEQEKSTSAKEEMMLVGYIDCKKVREAEAEELYGLEEDDEERSEERKDTEGSDKRDELEEEEEAEEEADESEEVQGSEMTEAGDEEKEEGECCEETCHDDVCDPNDSVSRDEILSFFGVRADSSPALVLGEESVVSLPFVQNTELFGQTSSHRFVNDTKNPYYNKNNEEMRGRIFLSSVLSGDPNNQRSSHAIVQKPRNHTLHKNCLYGRIWEIKLNNKRLKPKNRKRKHLSTQRFNHAEHHRKRMECGNSSASNPLRYFHKDSDLFLRPDIFAVKREIPYFKSGEILQPLIEPTPRLPLKNSFLQEFRGVPKDEISRFAGGETGEGDYLATEDEDAPEGGGTMKGSEGWVDPSRAAVDLFGAPLSYDQCEQCLPCCAYFSHRETELGSFQWNVEDECKPDDRDLDVASAECRTCHVRRRPAGQGVTLTCYECAAQQPDQTCRLGPRNPEMSQYRVSARFFIISQSNATSSTMTQAQSLMARRPQYFVPHEGMEIPEETEAPYPFEEEEEDDVEVDEDV